MDTPLRENLEQIRDKIDKNLIWKNHKRIHHNYHVGDRINIEIWNNTKKLSQLEDTFTIKGRRTNGTVDFPRTSTVVENIGIRKI